jgi:hypothetical protein
LFLNDFAGIVKKRRTLYVKTPSPEAAWKSLTGFKKVRWKVSGEIIEVFAATPVLV